MKVLGRITTVVLIAWAIGAVVVGISSRKDVGRYLKIRSM
jgi:hypothetical protein